MSTSIFCEQYKEDTSVTNPSRAKTPKHDRFIPRLCEDIEVPHFNINTIEPIAQTPTVYQEALSNTLCKTDQKILVYKHEVPRPPASQSLPASMRSIYDSHYHQSENTEKTYHRHIPTSAERTLDAPDLVNDYYLNLVDWNQQNMLAIALGQGVYLWHHATGQIQHLFTTPEGGDIITSVAWMNSQSEILAVGTADKLIQLWDVGSGKKLRNMKGHEARVSALAWNQHLLSSGSRDQNLLHHDVRVAQALVAAVPGAHSQEVCGLKWSPDGSQLASGGNDNALNIWEFTNPTRPVYTFNHHQAAVKAIAWCPWQSKLLATGGGTADRKLRFWNTGTGACLNCIDTSSQVSSIQWSPHSKELVSAHGFSENQLIVWKYPSMTKLGELKGHEARILHTALSPDGETVASAGADETLRFWKVFEKPYKATKSSKKSEICENMKTIR